ncbi:MAG: histidine phosphatase family protein [Chloroflexi bacterium]|nr:histidine phosphatase family protein [Chloroflexota bacterium]
MSELWLVRHGETDWNRERRLMGQLDIPLNAEGILQAAELAASLQGQPFDVLVSSDLLRARQTAETLAAALNLPLHLDPRLREEHLGAWQGLTIDEIQARYPGQWEQRRADPPDFRPPGEGETIAEMAARACAAMDEIAAAHPRGRVLVVSHGILIAALLCRANNLPLARIFEHNPANARAEVVRWPPAGHRSQP